MFKTDKNKGIIGVLDYNGNFYKCNSHEHYKVLYNICHNNIKILNENYLFFTYDEFMGKYEIQKFSIFKNLTEKQINWINNNLNKLSNCQKFQFKKLQESEKNNEY